ncbi:hypothetical protein DRN34_03935, partial [Thermococci archaeon]
MRRILSLFMLLLFAGNALAMSVELGIDEVLIVDNTTVTFDVPQNNPNLVFLFLESENSSLVKGLHFGESVLFEGVNYTVGSLDLNTLTLTLHLSGNYSTLRVLKKRDFEVSPVESFDAYVKVKIKNTGYYEINDTLVVSAQGVEIEERDIDLKPGESLTLKISPSYNQLTFMLKDAKLLKSITVASLEELVTIERIWKDGKLHVLLRNHGDPANVTLKLLVSGMTFDKKEVFLNSKEEKEVVFDSDITQGTILLDYGVIKQESFYFEMPKVSLVRAEKENEKLKIWLRNDGKVGFSGRVSIYQSSVIVGEPYFIDVTIKPNEVVYLEFKVPEDTQILTVMVTSSSYSATFPISLKAELT